MGRADVLSGDCAHAATLVAALALACGEAHAPSAHGAVSGVAADSVAAPTLRLTRCWVAGVRAEGRCGTFVVPENRAAGGGRQIALKVVVLPARGAVRAPDPIFLLTGGPGLGAATEAWQARMLNGPRDSRDVVLVDQRGTGASAPLGCAIYGDGSHLAPFLGDRFPVAAVRACRMGLEGGADLTQYTTPIAMDDLDEVRAALGYDRINLFGVSYGTRAALVYLRRHPERVRSVVLDGVVTTAYRTPLPAAAAGDRALRRLFDDCARDAACATAFPNVAAEYQAVLDRLSRAPARVTLTRYLGLARETAVLTRYAFARGVWGHLYAEREAARLPALIHRAFAGDLAGVARDAAEQFRGSWTRTSVGALLSVLCTEDVPFIRPEEVAAEAQRSLVGAPYGSELLAACAEWPRGALPPDYREPVRSGVPALLISGELDPITPPEWAEEAARYLPNSRHVVHAYAGHVDDGACTLGLVGAFFARPEPRAPAASCAPAARRRAFVVE